MQIIAKTIEEFKKNENVKHIFEDIFTEILLKSLEDYIFFKEDNYIYLCKKYILEDIKALLIFQKKNKNFQSDFIIERKYEIFKLDKVEDLILDYFPVKISFQEENYNIILPEKNISLFFIKNDGIYKFFYQRDRKYFFILKTLKQFSKEEKSLAEMLFNIHIIKLNCRLGNIIKDIEYKDFQYLFCELDKLITYNSKQELIETIFEKKINFNLNKLSFEKAISFAWFLELIEISDYQKFYEYIKNISEEKVLKYKKNHSFIDVRFKRKKIIITNFLLMYFKERVNTPNDYLIFDFISMKKLLKEKISLKTISMKKIIEKHDEMVFKTTMKLYKEKTKVHEKFKKVKLKNVQILKSTKEIIKESIIQNNCVASYIPRINNGNCIIGTTIYKNIRYTLEIKKRKEKYILNQINGYKNKVEVPLELIDSLKNELKQLI